MSKNDVLGGALAEVAGPLKDLLSKLGGKDAEMWLGALKRFLRKENPWEQQTPTTFPIWRTVTVGGKNKIALITEMQSKGFKICDWALDMMGKVAFTTSPEPIELRLVRPTVQEIGFPEGASTKDLWIHAQGLGLQLCPAEVGPHLRLADADQPKDDWYWIGMKPITDSGGDPDVFIVGRDDYGRWLTGGGVARLEDGWRPESRIVFVAPGA